MSPALAGGFFTTTCSAASVELTHPGSASLEKGMASPFSILALRTPRTEESGSYSPQGHKESDMTEATQQTHARKDCLSPSAVNNLQLERVKLKGTLTCSVLNGISAH